MMEAPQMFAVKSKSVQDSYTGLTSNYRSASTYPVANEIPVLAVDSIEVSKNDSMLYDEMLALRIGLIPLKADKTFALPEECTCKGKGCMKCTASLVLKASGPGVIRAGMEPSILVRRVEKSDTCPSSQAKHATSTGIIAFRTSCQFICHLYSSGKACLKK
jgi:hypothetical protein